VPIIGINILFTYLLTYF